MGGGGGVWPDVSREGVVQDQPGGHQLVLQHVQQPYPVFGRQHQDVLQQLLYVGHSATASNIICSLIY